jgi:acetyl esterase/lipase
MPFVEDRSILSLESRAPDREIRYGDDPLHIADVWESRPQAGGPLVVLIHGGFWRPAFDRKHLGPFANAIADAGFTVASVEYRRVPGSPDLMIEDVALACARVPQRLGAKDNRAIVIGHSAGGHLALWCATGDKGRVGRESPVETGVSGSALSIIALAPVASLVMGETLNLGTGAVTAFLGTPATARPELDPFERTAPTVPVTIVHGTADETVPIALSEQFQNKFPATRLLRVEGNGHFAVIDPRSDVWPILSAEIRRLSR